MPFLTLNGVTVPTSVDGGTISRTLYGEYSAAYDGTAQNDVRARKKVWDFTTKPINPNRAAALVGLIEGNGLFFPYTANLYATNGIGSTTSTGTTFQSNTAADGKPVVDENDVAMSPYGAASLQADRGVTNLLAAAVAECSSITGWAFSGSTSGSLNTTRFWEAVSSIQVNIAASGAAFTPTTNVSSGTHYVFSGFIYSTTVIALTLGLKDSSSTFATSPFTTNGASGWQRFFITGTPTAGTSTQLEVFSASGGTGTIEIDGLQLESPALGYTTPTAWQNPASGARSTSNLVYDANLSSLGGFTLSGWLMDVPSTPSGSVQVLFEGLSSTSSQLIQVDVSLFSGSQVIRFLTINDAGTASDVLRYVVTPPLYGFLVCTLNVNPVTGQPTKSIYWNGALVASDTSTTFPINTTMTQLGVCGSGGTAGNSFQGRINNLQLLPYAVDQNWVSGVYGYAGLNGGNTPLLTMAGTCINNQFKSVYGQIKKEAYVGFQDPTLGWMSQGRTLNIILTEV